MPGTREGKRWSPFTQVYPCYTFFHILFQPQYFITSFSTQILLLPKTAFSAPPTAYTELLPSLTWPGDILRGHSAAASSRKPSLINLPLGLGTPQTPGHILATTDKTDSIITYFFVWLPWARILFHSLLLSRILTHLRSSQMTGGIDEQINGQFGVSYVYSLFAV